MQKRGYENFLIGKIIKTIYQKSKKINIFPNFDATKILLLINF